MRLRRREFLIAGGVAVAGGVGYGGYLLRSASPPPRRRTLTILSGPDQSRGRQRHELVREWNAPRTDGLGARIVEVHGVADAHRAEMVARAQADTHTVDIFNLDLTWLVEFAEAGYIQPLAQVSADPDEWLGPPLAACRYDGELWALPFNTDAGLLFARQLSGEDGDELFSDDTAIGWGDRADPVAPGLSISDRLREATADGTAPDTLLAGYAGQLADYEGATVNALEMVARGTELSVISDDWEDPEVQLVLLAPAVERLARAWRDRHNDPPEPPLILPASWDHDEPATTRAFHNGQVLFMRNWPVAHAELAGGVDPIPALPVQLPGRSVLGGQVLAVARRTPWPDEAEELIAHLTSHASQDTLLRVGGLPAARRAVYRDADPLTAATEYAVQHAQARPKTPYYPRFSAVFRAGLRKAAQTGGWPPGFAERLADALRGRYGSDV